MLLKVAITSGINNCGLKSRGHTFIAVEFCSVLFFSVPSYVYFNPFTWYKYYHTVGLSA